VYDAFGLVDDEQDLRRLATATAVIQTVPVAIISTVAVLTLIWSRLPLRARSMIIWVSIRVPIFGHSLTHIVNRDIFASVSRGSSHRDLFAQVDRALATPHGSSHSHANGSAHGSLGNGSHRSPKSHGHGHAGVQGEGIKLATFPAPPDEPCCWLCGGCENLVDEGTRYRCADECIALA